jgi:DNA-binding NtrC family response regulator
MGQQTRIVQIDDDQDACDLLKMQLENTRRMNVTYGTSSEEALAIINRELPDIAKGKNTPSLISKVSPIKELIGAIDNITTSLASLTK